MNQKYTPANRELVSWLSALTEQKIEKKAFQSTPTVISYETERQSKAFNALMEEMQEDEQKDSGGDDKLADIEKRINDAKTPEELASLEKELNALEGDSGSSEATPPATDSTAPSDTTEAPKEDATPAEGASPTESATPADPSMKGEVDKLKKEIEELKNGENVKDQVKSLQKQVDNLQPLDSTDLNDSINQSASRKIAYIRRQIRRAKAVKAIYFGKGYEKDAIEELRKILPHYEIKASGKEIEIFKNNEKVADIEFGPMSGYRYAKLSLYKNGELVGSVPVEKVIDVKEHLESQRESSKKQADLNTDQIEKVMNLVNSDENLCYHEIAETMAPKIGAKQQDIYDFLMSSDSAYGTHGNLDQRKL